MDDCLFRPACALLLAATLMATLVMPAHAQRTFKPAFGLVLDGYPIDSNRLQNLRDKTGLAFGMVTFFLQWPRVPGEGHFPLESLQAIHDAGAVPCLTWEPMYIEGGKEIMIDAKDILSGRYDALIDLFVRGAKRYGKPFIIRFAHEMNLERYHWGAPKDLYGPESPGLYRRMFRYIAQRFKAAKAANVSFAFCPNVESLPHQERDGAKWNEAGAYYPGDDVVDLVGMDGYNWGTTRTKDKHGWDSAFRSFPDIFGPMRMELAAIAPGKPMMVFETSCAVQGGDKTAWIRQALETATAWKLVALNWFEADKEVDWRLSAGTNSGLAGIIRTNTFGGPGLILSALRGGKPL